MKLANLQIMDLEYTKHALDVMNIPVEWIDRVD